MGDTNVVTKQAKLFISERAARSLVQLEAAGVKIFQACGESLGEESVVVLVVWHH